ncbi:MAG: 4Fe-4S binding protein [Bacteroidota bacterium]
MNYQKLRRLRIASQLLFMGLFLILFFWPQDQTEPGTLSKPFLLIDPLQYLILVTTTHKWISLLALSLIPLVLTLVFGRFFCGWICPMGSLQHFMSFLMKPFRKTGNTVTGGSLWAVKYVVFIPVILFPVLELNLAGWLDPLSLLTRSLAGLYNPILLLIFIGIILLNIRRHRFFCRVLCPLGALYGLVARFRLFRWIPQPSCTGCGKCSYSCPAGMDLPQEHASSECLLCMNCANACPEGALKLKRQRSDKVLEVKYLPKRRVVITTLAVSAAWALLPRLTLAKTAIRRTTLVRPPGSLAEPEFLDRCTRCGQCMQSCPTGFIKTADIDEGIETLWTPVCSGESGGCNWECVNCTYVCPSGAIRKLSLKEKQKLKIGTAVLDKNLCYTYADGFNCTACYESCPVPGKAISFRQAEMIDFRGDPVTVNQAFILTDECTGCGLCVKACPRTDRSAMQILPDGEDRNNPGM